MPRIFEALGPMLRAVASGRSQGDVVVFGPAAAVGAVLALPLVAVAPVEGVEWGALATACETVNAALWRLGLPEVAEVLGALVGDAAALGDGSAAALEWCPGAAPKVHLLRPAQESPAPTVTGPQVFPTERALIEAAAALPGAALSVCVVGAAEELHALTDAMPVGFVAGRNRGASLVAPARLVGRLRSLGRGADAEALEEVAREPLDGPRVFEASELAAVMLSSVEAHLARVEGAAASRAREALGAESARRAGSGRLVGESEQRAGSGRLVGESEQRAAVAWAEALRAPYEPSSDDVSIQWGDGTQHHVATHLKLPHVGSAARPWCFEGAVRELLAFRPRFAPQAPRVAFFVGAVLCRVWTATGGSGGGPALVRLDEGERRADVLRPDEGAGEDE